MYEATLRANPTNTFINVTDPIYDEEIKKIQIFPKKHVKNLPRNFDGRVVWKDYLVPAHNQYSCGSCWAFSTASCLSDRFNILSRGKYHVNLSGLSILLCDVRAEMNVNPETDADIAFLLDIETTEKFGCNGGSLAYAWKYVNKIGALSMECMNYSGASFSWFKPLSEYQSDGDLPLCSDITSIYGDTCTSNTYDAFTGSILGTPALFYRAQNYYHIEGVENIMQEIFKNGPVNSGMAIYQDFYEFNPKTEIYKSKPGQNIVAGHAVEIVGWGESSNEKYWIIKNSWGANWGDGGYFKMARGINDCQIEKNMVTGIPNFFTMPGTSTLLKNGYSERMFNLWKNRPGFSVPQPMTIPADFIAGEIPLQLQAGARANIKKCAGILIATGILLIVLIVVIILTNKHCFISS